MPTCNSELRDLEHKLQQEFQETTARRQKLEDAIKKVEASSRRLIEMAALQDIEAYKNRRPLPSQTFRTRSELDRQPAAALQGAIVKSSVRSIESKKEFLPAPQSATDLLPLSLIS
jgi:hypothetical protein